MNSDTGDSNGAPDSGQQPDAPLDILLEQEFEPSPGFVAKVRRRIDRRASAAQFATFTWNMPKVVAFELAGILRHLIGSLGGRKDTGS